MSRTCLAKQHMMSLTAAIAAMTFLLGTLVRPATAQEATATETAATTDEGDPADETPSIAKQWDREFYIPFRDLAKVFDNHDATVIVPYAEYMELIQKYLAARENQNGWSPDAVITSSSYAAVVEKDVVRIQATLQLNVLKDEGWARVPLTFGSAAIGKLTPDDESTLLRGTGPGRYELLLKGAGVRTVELELLATVRTSPENKSFSIETPPTGMTELTVTLPDPDQSIQISPLQVLLPVESPSDEQTHVKASLGAVQQFEVRWNPRAGTKPVMDLLASARTRSVARIEPGLLQTTTTIDYEILRGELREVSVSVPLDARVIDVVSVSGRIKSWNVKSVDDSRQQILMELLSPVSDGLQIEIQTERTLEGDTFQLVGQSEEGQIQGVHADNVVRESGQVLVTTDPALTTVVRKQSGVKRVEADASGKSGSSGSAESQAWEFSGITGQLILQVRPVEPRLLVDQTTRLIFDDDELRLSSQLVYTVERAGVFQLQLQFPETLTIDTVRADGMSEFSVDKDAGQLLLSLTQKRMGSITVDITGHQPFNAAAENQETELPSVTPVGVERETGRITVYAPQFVDVMTVDEKLTGLFPSTAEDAATVGRAVRVSSWNYTRRPVALFVRTTPRPAQLAAAIATTIRIEPEIMKLSSLIAFQIQNAGLDTLRIAVPEAVAGNVRFQAVSSGHVIQQRNRAEQAEDGWVTWTLILQSESTGEVRIAADWETRTAAEGNENAGVGEVRSMTIEPPRVLPPFSAEQSERRRVTLTQTRGEIRILRHESLSIAADDHSDAVEPIDVRELELMDADGYLAYRYFRQPASVTVEVRKHEIHEVVATVVSRSLIEVVTEKQETAAYRCRYRIVTSERQRLRIDLPEDCDLQAPTVNGQRTTVERATDVTAAENMEAYYINIGRDATSDTSFLLTVQFRCRVVAEGQRAFAKRGSNQILNLPTLGNGDGATVVQQTMLAVWAPKDIAFIGDPDHWTQFGRARFSLTRPLDSPTSDISSGYLNEWISDTWNGATDFATQGHVSLYRAVGVQPQIELTWWNRPFLFWVISGTLVLAALILRRTPWENRITIILLAAFAISMWWLKDGYTAMQFVSAAWPGACIAAAIWLTSLILGRHDTSSHSANHGPGNSGPSSGGPGPYGSSPPTNPHATAPGVVASPAGGASTVPAGASTGSSGSGQTEGRTTVPVVTPAPEVTDLMDKLMGGKS